MNSFQKALANRSFLIGALTFCLILLVAVGCVSFYTSLAFARSFRGVHTNHRVMHQVDTLLSTVQAAESAERGFVLTGDDSFLDSYQRAISGIPLQMENIRALAEDEPALQKRLTAIFTLVATRRQEMDAVLAARRLTGLPAAAKVLRANESRATMNHLRTVINNLQDDRARILEARTLEAARTASSTQLFSILFILLDILLVGAIAYYLLTRLHEFETILTICAWTKRIKLDGEWVSFEDFLERRFNLRMTHGMSEEEAAKWKIELENRKSIPPPS